MHCILLLEKCKLNCIVFSSFKHSHVCFSRFSALSIESEERNSLVGATRNNGEHKDYKRESSGASWRRCEHLQLWTTTRDQELQSDLCCCDGECGEHVLLLAAGRDAAFLTATGGVIFITERMKEIWKKLGS